MNRRITLLMGTLLASALQATSGSALSLGFGCITGNLAGDCAIGEAQPNGVNPLETLGVVFNLTGGGTFADIVNELTTGELRIGIHVQGFGTGGSESFVNLPVPEPGTALLLGLGLGVLGLRRRD